MPRKARSNKGKKRGSYKINNKNKNNIHIKVRLNDDKGRIVKIRKIRSNKGKKRTPYRKKISNKLSLNSNSKKEYLSKNDQDSIAKEYTNIMKTIISGWNGIGDNPEDNLKLILKSIPKINYDPKYRSPFSNTPVNKKSHGNDALYYQVKFKIDAFLKYGSNIV